MVSSPPLIFKTKVWCDTQRRKLYSNLLNSSRERPHTYFPLQYPPIHDWTGATNQESMSPHYELISRRYLLSATDLWDIPTHWKEDRGRALNTIQCKRVSSMSKSSHVLIYRIQDVNGMIPWCEIQLPSGSSWGKGDEYTCTKKRRHDEYWISRTFPSIVYGWSCYILYPTS